MAVTVAKESRTVITFMPVPPVHPKIYHITHVDNLLSIIQDGGLVSDAAMIARGGPAITVGMTSIKHRRLTLPVDCHQGDCVGDYVPFYFCSRSVMLYIIHMANNAELTYKGGQRSIVHLEADMATAIKWANGEGRRWTFSLSNAGTYYAQFRKSLAELSEINCPAVAETDFRLPEVKEGKQAEFLVHGFFPWVLVNRIGVCSRELSQRTHSALDAASHRPTIELRPDWYFSERHHNG